MGADSRSLTRHVSEFAVGLRLEDVGEAVRAKAKLHIIDSVGCGIAGARSELAQQVLRYLDIEHREGPCRILGDARRFGPAAAAFGNSAAMNALDFDDGFEIAGKGMGHPGASIVAAAASAAYMKDITGSQFLTAVIAAYEINNRLIRAMQPTFERYLQVYGVCQHQSVATSIAYGKLLGLDETALENVIGLAATLANVPSLRKYNWERRPLISFKDFNAPATEAGVRAVQLNACGLSGSKDVLDGDHGLWRMLGSDQFDAASILSELGTSWTLHHNSFKSFPVCRWMHTALEAFAAVVDQHDLLADHIELVTVHTSSGIVRDFMQRTPSTMVDAQFSLPYAIAVQAFGIAPGAEWYETTTMRRNDLNDFAKHVVAVVDPTIDSMMTGPQRRPAARVDVCCAGRVYRSEVFEYPSGSADNPIPATIVYAKFIANTAPFLGKTAADALLLKLQSIEEAPNSRFLLETSGG